MTLLLKHSRLTISLMLFLWFSNLQTNGQLKETCISGDCKKGFGMQFSKTGAGFYYQVGNFDRKGKLNGEGIEFQWDYNSRHRETEFLNKWKSKIPVLGDIQEFRPSEIRIGNFKDGLLEGNGTIVQTNPVFSNPHLSWITKADFNPFTNRTIRYLKYEGNFIGSQIQKKGIVTLIYWPSSNGPAESSDTLICVSDNLFQEKEKKNMIGEIINAEMVIETKSKNAPQSIFHEPVSLLKGTFVNRKLNGWAIRYKPYFKNRSISKFHRELWFYGEKIYGDNGGAYPFDMDNSQTIMDENGREVTGPVRNGKVNGFGTIVNKSELFSYTGNIINNKADGYGVRTKNGIQYGIFKSDSLVSGILEYSSWNEFRITRGMFDGFKEGNVSIITYPSFTDFIEGKPFKEKYEGYIKAGIGAHGYGKEWSGTIVREGQFENGRYVGGSSILYNVTVNMVLSKDGIASFVTKLNYDGSIIELADGRTIKKTDLSSWKPSRHSYQSFFKNCTCGGDGTSWKNVSVAGSSNSWTRTEQVNRTAVTGYWQGTQQVTTTTYTPGYNYDVKTSCSNTNAIWIRVGFSGLAHVLPASVVLKE